MNVDKLFHRNTMPLLPPEENERTIVDDRKLKIMTQNVTASRANDGSHSCDYPNKSLMEEKTAGTVDPLLSKLHLDLDLDGIVESSMCTMLCGSAILDKWDQAQAERGKAEFGSADESCAIRTQIENTKSLLAQYELHEKVQKALAHTKALLSELETVNGLEQEKFFGSDGRPSQEDDADGRSSQKADADPLPVKQPLSPNKNTTNDASRNKTTSSSVCNHAKTLDSQAKKSKHTHKRSTNLTIPKITNRSRWVAEFLRLNNMSSSTTELKADSLAYSNTRGSSTIRGSSGASLKIPRTAAGNKRLLPNQGLKNAVFAGQMAASETNEKVVPTIEYLSPSSIPDMFLPADLFMAQVHRVPSMVLLGVSGEAPDDEMSDIEGEDFVEGEEEEHNDEEYPFDEYDDYDAADKFKADFNGKADGSSCSSTKSCSCTNHGSSE